MKLKFKSYKEKFFFYGAALCVLFFLFVTFGPSFGQSVITDVPDDFKIQPTVSKVPPPKVKDNKRVHTEVPGPDDGGSGDAKGPAGAGSEQPDKNPASDKPADGSTSTPASGSGNNAEPSGGQGSNPSADNGQPGSGDSVPPPPNVTDPGSTGGSSTSGAGTVKTQISPIVQIAYIVVLVLILGFLAFYYYKNYMLNLRVQRLEILIEKRGLSPISQEEPTPFSWDQALKVLEGGWELFSEENRIYQPGVVVMMPKSGDVGFYAAANLIYRTISEQNMAVIYLSRERGEEELGRRLLAIESGVALEELPAGEREELVRRYAVEMSKYERGLFIFRDFNISMDDLYEHVLKISENLEVGLVIIDGRTIISSDDLNDLIGKLRIIGIKTYIPMILIDPLEDINPDDLPEDTLDRMTALMGISGNLEKETVKFKIHKFVGDPPPEKMNFDSNTGEITAE